MADLLIFLHALPLADQTLSQGDRDYSELGRESKLFRRRDTNQIRAIDGASPQERLDARLRQ